MAKEAHCLVGKRVVEIERMSSDGTSATCVAPVAEIVLPGQRGGGVFTVLDIGLFGKSVHDGANVNIQGLDFAYVSSPSLRAIVSPSPAWAAQRRQWLLRSLNDARPRRWFDTRLASEQQWFVGDALSDTGSIFLTGNHLSPPDAHVGAWARIVTPCGTTTAEHAYAVSSALLVMPRPPQVVPDSSGSQCVAHASADLSLDDRVTWHEAPRDGAWRTSAASGTLADTPRRTNEDAMRSASSSVPWDDESNAESSCGSPAWPLHPVRLLSRPPVLGILLLVFVSVLTLTWTARRRRSASAVLANTPIEPPKSASVVHELRDRAVAPRPVRDAIGTRLAGMVVEARCVNAWFDDGA